MDEFGVDGSFDIIFCRNVLIYFDLPTKTKVLSSMCQIMQPDGFLLLGGAETVLGISDKFKIVTGEHGLYVKESFNYEPPHPK